MDPDRDLLAGLLSLRTGVVTRHALIRAIRLWAERRTEDAASEFRTALREVEPSCDDECWQGLQDRADQWLKQRDNGSVREIARELADEWRLSDLLGEILGTDGPSQSRDPQQDVTMSPTPLSSLGNATATLGPDDITASGPFAMPGCLAPLDSASNSSWMVPLCDERFVKGDKLAEGGLGVIHKAYDRELDRHVVLKEIKGRLHLYESVRSQFLREAKITGSLCHPGIVAVYSLGEDEERRPYYSMRLIEGENLKVKIRAFHNDESLKRDPGQRMLRLRALLRHFLAVCDAISFAHSKRIVHRDIKPENIMVGLFGETLMLDWGLAKVLPDRETESETETKPAPPSEAAPAILPAEDWPAPLDPLSEGDADDLEFQTSWRIHGGADEELSSLRGEATTATLRWRNGRLSCSPAQRDEVGDPSCAAPLPFVSVPERDDFLIAGTPSYMSPEQARGDNALIDQTSDVYGLGATLYCLIAGRPPIEHRGAANLPSSLKRTIHGKFPPPRKINSQIPPALESICLKAMRLDPQDRYPSAQAMAQDIERWLADEPVSVHREPWIGRAARHLRKHRSRYSIIAVAAGVAIALTLGSIAIYSRSANRYEARRLVGELLKETDPVRIKQWVLAVRDRRGDATPELVKAFENREKTRQGARLRAALALARLEAEDSRWPAFLREALYEANPREVIAIRDALAESPDWKGSRAWLREALAFYRDDVKRQLRIAAALAESDRDDPRWNDPLMKTLAKRLVREPLLEIRDWTEALDALGPRMVEALSETFSDRKQPIAAQSIAAELLVRWTDGPEPLAALVPKASEEQFPILISGLARFRDRALPLLRMMMAAPPPAPKTSKQGRNPPDFPEPETRWLGALSRARGLSGRDFAFCLSMPASEFAEVAEGLKTAGYRPSRVRPWFDGGDSGEPRIAALWARDSAETRWVLDLTPETVKVRDQVLSAEGFVLIDLALYGENGADRSHDPKVAGLWMRARGLATAKPRRLEILAASGPLAPKRIWLLNTPSPHGGWPIAIASWAVSDDRWHRALIESDAPRAVSWLIDEIGLEAAQNSGIGIEDATLVEFGKATAQPGGSKPLYSLLLNSRAEGWEHRAQVADSLEAHETISRAMIEQGFSPLSVHVAMVAGHPTAVSCWRRPALTPAEREAHAAKQAQILTASLMLGDSGEAWSALRRDPQPSLRSWFLERAGALRLDPKMIASRVWMEPDPGVRQALILALGDRQPPNNLRQDWVERMLRIFGDDPNSGVHSAAEWTLAQWIGPERVAEERAKLAAKPLRPGRDWHVNALGMTFARVDGRRPFLMGTPLSEARPVSAAPYDVPHVRRIGRVFGLATQEVTVALFRRFLDEHPDTAIPYPTAGAETAVGNMSWFTAAKFCRWLDEMTGVPDAERCYPPIPEIGPQMELPANFFQRSGHRLPTLAELELACRAGTVSFRFFGETEKMTSRYASASESQSQLGRVGQLRPNDWGFFDLLGNAWEWTCVSSTYQRMIGVTPQPIDDESLKDINLMRDDQQLTLMFGGSCDQTAPNLFSSVSALTMAKNYWSTTGFRVLRSWPESPKTEMKEPNLERDAKLGRNGQKDD